MKTLQQIKDEVSKEHNGYWANSERSIDKVIERYAEQTRKEVNKVVSYLHGRIEELQSELITLKSRKGEN